MQIVNRKIAIPILLIHTAIVCWDAYRDIGAKEQWKFFFSFFVDFPISVIFSVLLKLVDYFINSIGVSIDIFEFNVYALFILHLVIGGLW